MTDSEREQHAMRRACELALRGPRGLNPQVGAVILSPDGEILAEGWHRGAGTAHAEVDAVSQLAPGTARGATAVITLEPCNHTGRTGPCALALVEAGIARVVYAIDEPTAVSQGGAQRLRSHGVEVIGGVGADDVRAFLASWLEVARLGRPHVTLKWAQSLDGRAAAADGTSTWITGEAARADVHRRRAQADAIVVGTGTLLADDPALTARRPDGTLHDHQPRPIVLGSRPIPADAAVLRHPLPVLRHRGRDLADLLEQLREEGVHRVFVEGGPTIASAFVRAGLVDEVLAYTAPVLLGGDRLALGDLGVPTITDAIRLRLTDVQRLGDDVLFVAERTAPAGAELPAPEVAEDATPEGKDG